MASKGRIELEQVVDPKLLITIKELREELTVLAVQFSNVVKSGSEMGVSTNKANVSLDEMNKLQQQQIELEKKLVSQREQIEKTLKKITEEQAKYNAQVRDAKELAKANAVINDKEAGTIEKTTAWIRRLGIERKKLNLETKEGKNRLVEINKELDKHNKVLQDTADKTLAQKQNIGNYKSALVSLGNAANDSMGTVARATTRVAGAFGTLGTGITAAVGILSAPFVAFFSLTEKGFEMMERKVAGFKASMGVLGGDIAKLGEQIIGEDTGPIKWGNIFSNVGQALLTTANIIPGVRKYFEGLKDRMNEAADAAERFTRTQQELEEQEYVVRLERAKTDKQLAKAKLLYEEEGLSAQQKYDRLKTVLALEKQMSDEESKFAVQRRIALEFRHAELIQMGLTNEAEKIGFEITELKIAQLDREKESLIAQRKATKLLQKAEEELNGTRIKTMPATGMATGEVTMTDVSDSMFAQSEAENAIYWKEREFEAIDEMQKEFQKNQEKDKEDAKKAEEQRIEDLRELAIVSAQAVGDVGNALFDRKLDQIEAEKNAEILAAGDNAAKKEEIEKKYAKKIAEAKRKQAIWDKATSIVQIAINTALAIAKALPNLVLAGIAGVQGAAQLAIATAKKIPEVPAYFKGVFSHPGGSAIVGEKGRELVTLNNGQQFLTPERATFMNLPAGAEVMPNDVLRAELAGMPNMRGYSHIEPNLQGAMLSTLMQIRDNEQYDLGDYVVIKKGNVTKKIRKNK